jgi:hypothetical protein
MLRGANVNGRIKLRRNAAETRGLFESRLAMEELWILWLLEFSLQVLGQELNDCLNS